MFDFEKYSIAFLNVGDEWRKLRRILKDELFSKTQLDSSQGLRKDKVEKLRVYVRECAISGRAVVIGVAAFVTALNTISGMLLSVDFANFDSGLAQEVKGMIGELMEVIGTPHVADFIPLLHLLDPQRIQSRSRKCYQKLLAVFDNIVNERLQSEGVSCSTAKKDLLRVLIDLSQGGTEFELKPDRIKYLLLVCYLINL